jgi:hypothetical protein
MSRPKSDPRQLGLFSTPADDGPAVGAFGKRDAATSGYTGELQQKPPSPIDAVRAEIESERFAAHVAKENLPDDFDPDTAGRPCPSAGAPYHRCGWPGCTETVPAMHWGCLMHTWSLPFEIRHALYPRCSLELPAGTLTVRPEHLAANKAAQEYIARTSLPRK